MLRIRVRDVEEFENGGGLTGPAQRMTSHGRSPMQKAALYTSGAVFAAVAVAHVVRLATGFEIVVGGAVVPVWVSGLGALIAALLAVWMVAAVRRF